MAFIEQMWAKARELRKNLVLPEGTDPRMVQAARRLADEGLVGSVTLLGARSEIDAAAKNEGVDLSGVQVVDPGEAANVDRLSTRAEQPTWKSTRRTTMSCASTRG